MRGCGGFSDTTFLTNRTNIFGFKNGCHNKKNTCASRQTMGSDRTRSKRNECFQRDTYVVLSFFTFFEAKNISPISQKKQCLNPLKDTLKEFFCTSEATQKRRRSMTSWMSVGSPHDQCQAAMRASRAERAQHCSETFIVILSRLCSEGQSIQNYELNCGAA